MAKAGYLALAPDLFVRQGDASREQSIADLMANIVRKTPDSDVMGDLDVVAEWAHTNGGDAGRPGITGFCYGGRITWLYSHHNPQVKAGVAWHGRPVGERTAAWPALPVDIAPALKVPVLGLYGGKDRGITLDSLEQMRAAVAQGSSKSTIHVYPDARTASTQTTARNTVRTRHRMVGSVRWPGSRPMAWPKLAKNAAGR